MLAPLRVAALAVPGVRAIEKLAARRVGTGYRVTVHVQAAPALSLADAHSLGGRVKHAMCHSGLRIDSVLVHMEPYMDAEAGTIVQSTHRPAGKVRSGPDPHRRPRPCVSDSRFFALITRRRCDHRARPGHASHRAAQGASQHRCRPRDAPTQVRRPTHRPAITPLDLMTRLYKFADDSMMGRLAGTPWNDKGTDYIAAEVKRLGLTPAG